MRRRIGILFILVGLGVFFYPELSTWKLNNDTRQYVETFEKKNPAAGNSGAKEADGRYQECLFYNQKIYENGQSEFKDAWSYVQNPVSVESFSDGKFGYIQIPEMKVKLSLYLGASETNMIKGAAVLGGTSLPIGGKGTNSVIAGHRGYRGIPFFREIERLKTGDKVIIRNPWEKLVYRVSEIRIIDPYDSDTVKIQDGKDMITLITCHPYRSHGKQRYVVYCERDNGKKNEQTEEKDFARTVISSQEDIEREKYFRVVCGICILPLGVWTLRGGRKGTK